MAPSRKRTALSPVEDDNMPRNVARTARAGKLPIIYRLVAISRPPVPVCSHISLLHGTPAPTLTVGERGHAGRWRDGKSPADTDWRRK